MKFFKVKLLLNNLLIFISLEATILKANLVSAANWSTKLNTLQPRLLQWKNCNNLDFCNASMTTNSKKQPLEIATTRKIATIYVWLSGCNNRGWSVSKKYQKILTIKKSINSPKKECKDISWNWVTDVLFSAAYNLQ